LENLFRIFSADKQNKKTRNLLEKQTARCKVQDVERFKKETHWVIDRWWTRDERIALAVVEPADVADKDQVQTLIQSLKDALVDYDGLVAANTLGVLPSKKVELGDKKLFTLFIGERVLKKDARHVSSKIPVYSANVYEPMGFVEKSNIKGFKHPAVLWGIDGDFEFNLIPANVIFATTDHCGAIQILDSSIVPEYLLYALTVRRMEETFDRSFRPSLANMRRFSVSIPIKSDGTFDIEAQKVVAARFTGLQEKRENLQSLKSALDAVFEGYLNR
jgi:type I restriction enzyme M protein